VRRALERVGEEVSGILQRAHDTAEKITANSRSEAEDRLEAARREASQLKAEAERELDAARQDAVEIRAAAERQLTDLDADTDRIWAERHRIVEDARELARQLLELADAAAERFPPADDTETGETVVAGDTGQDTVEATAILPTAEDQDEAAQDAAEPPDR
jgi:predicted phage gp36 major capsid-like protein